MNESKLIETKNTIKVYDGETGTDVTSKFWQLLLLTTVLSLQT